MKLWIRLAVLSVAAAGLSVPGAQAAGPGGWDHLGTGATASTASLNNDVLAMSTDLPGVLLAGGKFTNAGGLTGRNRLASWNGTAWSTVGGTSTLNADVTALAVSGTTIYVGGLFTNAGGVAAADGVAAWDGSSWSSPCTGSSSFIGTVAALEIIGTTLFVGGSFQDAYGNTDADYLLACDLATGTVTGTTTTATFSGPVYALASDSAGKLYAGGNFLNLDSNAASDYVAVYSGGGWANLGFGPGPDGHVKGIVRALATSGTDLYIGTDAVDVATLTTADHVARWNGSQWSPLGANTAGTNGYLPTVSGLTVDALLVSGTHVYAAGNWQNADAEPRADYIADFNTAVGTWTVPGTDGGAGAPLNAKAESLALFGGRVHAGGNFTAAGGDNLAKYVARFTGIRPLPPGNAIKLGKVTVKKKKGIALLAVKVPGPGLLEMLGSKVKHPERAVGAAGKVTLTVRPTGKTKRKLKADGSASVRVKVRFTPTGGTPRTESIRLTLVLKD